MEPKFPSPLQQLRRGSLWIAGAALITLGLSACASGPPELPEPRPVVIRSGARLYPDKDRMKEVDSWFRAQVDNIENDPSFWVIVVPRDTPSYPWESVYIESADTVRIGVESGKSREAEMIYQVYAHYRLMAFVGRLEEFLPGGSQTAGYVRERAILERLAEAWLYGRGLYDAEAYDPLEELTYANEAGHLDAFLLTARGDEFQEERRAWLQEDPEGLERYRSWFVETFSREPPGLRGGG